MVGVRVKDRVGVRVRVRVKMRVRIRARVRVGYRVSILPLRPGPVEENDLNVLFQST